MYVIISIMEDGYNFVNGKCMRVLIYGIVGYI